MWSWFKLSKSLLFSSICSCITDLPHTEEVRSKTLISSFLICKNVLSSRPVLCLTCAEQYLTPRELPLKKFDDFQSKGSTSLDWKAKPAPKVRCLSWAVVFTFTCKCLRLICPDLYPSSSLTWVVCCDNKEAYCSQWNTRVHSHGSSFMIKEKKKAWLFLLKNLSIYKYINLTCGENHDFK